MLLANDQIWQEYQSRRRDLQPGDSIVIRERSFGRYRMAGPDGLMTGVRQVDCSTAECRSLCLDLWETARNAGTSGH